MSPSTTTPNTPPSLNAAREIRRDTPLRRARTCYTHLAGLAGVTLTDTLLSRRWIEEAGISRGRVDYRLTPSGEKALLDRGVIIPVPSRTQRYAYGCVDWTERRCHLAGGLGAAILDRLFADGIVARLPAPGGKPLSNRNPLRALSLQRPLETWLGLPV